MQSPWGRVVAVAVAVVVAVAVALLFILAQSVGDLFARCHHLQCARHFNQIQKFRLSFAVQGYI